MAVMGLGYVGLPLAAAFAKQARVIGYDVNAPLIEGYRMGVDPTGSVDRVTLLDSGIEFSSDPARLGEAEFIIVAAPTPITHRRTPDLEPLKAASRTLGTHIRPGTLIAFESTVYPGVTEEVCLPIIARQRGLVSGRDFFVGYAPERISPGDRVHTFENIVKLVAAQNPVVRAELSALYGLISQARVHPMSSIRAAEAAKLAENTQRDVNIAFMNELAVMLDALGIDGLEVRAAMATKWNAIDFRPGLVGGHCIGVDPYYLLHLAGTLGLPAEVTRAARQVNESMSSYVAVRLAERLAAAGRRVAGTKIALLGITFKENCPDLRGSGAELPGCLSNWEPRSPWWTRWPTRLRRPTPTALAWPPLSP